MIDALPYVELCATWFMTGVIWFVQVVHYPLMAIVGTENWKHYEARHTVLTSCVVGPAMLIEAASAAVVLALRLKAGLAGWELAAALGAAGLLIVIWASTFFVQVPIHRRLGEGFDAALHRRLVSSNRIRTVAWSLRGALLLMLL